MRDLDARIQAVLNRINYENGGNYTAEDVNVETYGSTTEFDTPVGTFMVLTEEESYDYLEEDIEQLIDDLGIYDLFGKDYSDYVVNNFVSWDNGQDYMVEDYTSYYDDIEYESASDDRFQTRCQEELYEKIGNGEDIESWLESYDDNRELYVEQAVEQIIDEELGYYGDPLGWANDHFGSSMVKHLVENGEVSVDYRGIAEWTVDIDGFGRIASYDGEDWEDDESEYHVYRTN